MRNEKPKYIVQNYRPVSRTQGSGIDLYGTTASDPVVAGTATEDQLLTSTDMVGHGTVTARQWQRSYDNVSWFDISGETGSTYTLQYQDVGYYVRISNTGDTTEYSNVIGVVSAMSVPATTPASPATGDIIDCTITTEAGGMTYASVTIKGFTTGATYDFGLGANNDPSSAKMYITVQSEGYDASGNLRTIKRRLYGTRVMYKVYPNDSTLDETVSGSDIIVKVALSDWIYNDDKNGGAGTSGRNPIIRTSAGWATNTGGGAQSATATNLSCTNNSTTDYPLPFGQWDMITNQRMTADFRMAFTPRHTHGIACCTFTALGLTSAVSSSQTTTAMSKRLRSATSLYGEAHEITMDVDQFTQGEAIELRCRVYPSVGDTAMDTNNYTTARDEVRGRNKALAYCDKNNTPVYAVVNFSTGNDGTAVTSTTLATANASPYLNVGKAIQGLGTTGGVVYIRAGTGDIFGSAPSSVLANTFWTEVKPYPSESVTLTLNASFYGNCPYRLKFSGLTILRNNTLGAVYGNTTTTNIWYDSIAFNDNGINPTFLLSEDMITTYVTNSTNFKLDKWGRAGLGSVYDGNVMTDTGAGSPCTDAFRCVACSCLGVGLQATPTASPAPDFDNGMWDHNKLMSVGGTGYLQMKAIQAYYATHQTIGISVCGNIIESCDSTQPALELFDGGSGECNSANVIIESNTIAGSRCNCGYNDSGSVAYTRLGWSNKNNAFYSWNVKGNAWPGSGGADGARTGSFPIEYGMNAIGNCVISTSFPGYFTGLYNNFSATMGFTNDNSTTGSDDGNGDYTPTGGSSMIGNRQPGQVQWDLFGNAVSNDIGAIQV